MKRFLAQLRATLRDELNALLAERYELRAAAELRTAQSFEADAELCRERAREWRNRAQVSMLLGDDYRNRVATTVGAADQTNQTFSSPARMLDIERWKVELGHHRDDDIVIPPFRFSKPTRAK
jgi:hypothetical protein